MICEGSLPCSQKVAYRDQSNLVQILTPSLGFINKCVIVILVVEEVLPIFGSY
jgi:hypothetical protein